ncbi:MAG: hypothetical protein RLZZ501_223 [Pseudomonadota bacterium]|jgi:CRP-like cAMP-binding protein
MPAPAPPLFHVPAPPPALHLSEEPLDPTGAALLAALEAPDLAPLRAASRRLDLPAGATAFRQGEPRGAIFVIDRGEMRIFHTGPSGREITLAYWGPGNFIGGPDLFDGGPHMWSGVATRPTGLWAVPGRALRAAAAASPQLALALIDALAHKGRCMSALIHLFGTRSARERLAGLLVQLAEREGRREGGELSVRRGFSHEDLARMIGATRQWVSATLEGWRRDGVIAVTPTRLVIHDLDSLRLLAN